MLLLCTARLGLQPARPLLDCKVFCVGPPTGSQQPLAEAGQAQPFCALATFLMRRVRVRASSAMVAFSSKRSAAVMGSVSSDGDQGRFPCRSTLSAALWGTHHELNSQDCQHAQQARVPGQPMHRKARPQANRVEELQLNRVALTHVPRCVSMSDCNW